MNWKEVAVSVLVIQLALILWIAFVGPLAKKFGITSTTVVS